MVLNLVQSFISGALLDKIFNRNILIKKVKKTIASLQ